MKSDVLLKLAIDFSLLSLVAVGGANAIVPEMHRQLVDVSHWMNDAEFVRLFAVGQVAPGPDIMVLSLVGWRMAGLSGMLVATLAALGPTCLLSWIMGRFVQRHGRAPWFDSVRRGLAPVAVGLILASGLVMARAADHTTLTVIATAATLVLAVASRINPLAALAFFGALAGLFAVA